MRRRRQAVVPFRSDIIGPAILLSIEPNVITDSTGLNCHAENGRRERVALLLANNAGSLAGRRRSLPSQPLSLFSPRHPISLSFSLSLSFSPTYATRSDLVSSPENSRVFVAPLCQPGLLPLLLVHCANSSTYSFIPPVLSHSCSRSRKVRLPANISFYHH